MLLCFSPLGSFLTRSGSLSLRSFDVEKDEHPVKWLVDKLAINLMPAIHTWLQSVAGGFQEPSTVAIPVPWFVELVLQASNQPQHGQAQVNLVWYAIPNPNPARPGTMIQ